MKLSLKVILFSITLSIIISSTAIYIVRKSLYDARISTVIDKLNKELYHIDYFMQDFIRQTTQDVVLLSTEEHFYKTPSRPYTSFINRTKADFVFNPTEEEQEIVDFFVKYKESKKQIEFVYVGFEDGSYNMNTPIMDLSPEADIKFDYDPRKRPWYIKAKNNPGQLVITEPYVAPAGYTFFLTAASSIIKEGEFLGVLGLDINIEDLTNYLQGIGSEEDGVFGILQENTSIVVTEENEIEIRDQGQKDTPWLNDIKYSNGYGFGKVFIEEIEYFALTLKAEKIPWIFYFLVPSENLENNINKIINNLLSPTIIAIVLLSILLILTVQLLVTKPIMSLTNEVTKFTDSGQINSNNVSRSRDEIGVLSSHFVDMVDEITRFRNEMEAIVKERTRDLEKLNQAIEQSPSSIVITDIKGNIEYVNPSFTKLTGYTLEEALGKNPRILKSGKTDENLFKELWETILSGSIWNGELLNKKKNGDLYWELVSIAPVKGESDVIHHFVAVKTDITESKRMTRELAEAKEAAEIATKTKSDFLANMSHEIRTPMNAIIGLNSLLANTDMTEKQSDYVGKIGLSARNLLGIINDILDFSKIEAGKLEMEEHNFDLNEVLGNLSDIMYQKAREKGLEFILFQKDLIDFPIVGDPLRLGQILLNLTNNAIKFTSEGEILITVAVIKKNGRECQTQIRSER